MKRFVFALGTILLLAAQTQSRGDDANPTPGHPLMPWIGYTELRTNLPGGRHANVRTERAVLIRADGSDRLTAGESLADNPDAWTQFAGWSPDGKTAIIYRGWQDPVNALWEDEHKTFRMEPGKWMLDCCLMDVSTGKITNITALDRVSHYNGGLFYLPENRGFGFTALKNGVSKPYVMDPDGRNKRDVSGNGSGFAYGYSASPDGSRISYHENYQIYVANADGSEKIHIKTGNPFDFGPQWSPDGQWLMFVSGTHGDSHPYVVQRDGTNLRKLGDRRGYHGSIAFLDVEDFHQGSSDTPVWSADGSGVFFTAKVGKNVEMFRTTLDGAPTQITHTPEGTLHYHPQPSADGKFLLYGSLRNGVRQLFVRNLADATETQITRLAPGYAAMWAHWQPQPGGKIQRAQVQRKRRALYNFDGDSCLFTKAGGKGPVAMTADDVKNIIAEVAYENSRVDTVLICINAQVMYYPTKVGTMRGGASTPEERAQWPASENQRFANLKNFFDQGIDPYALMLAESRRRGREALLSFRMNDNHGNDFLRTAFWRDHPECRLGAGALDFGRAEVRAYVVQLIEEAVNRYDCDGIELDFNRFPTFFKNDDAAGDRIAKMNDLVKNVRTIVDAVGRKRGRTLTLAVRVPSNYGRTPPTPESAKALGCDIAAWVQNRWVDFVTVSEFLHERGDLPIEQWKSALLPINPNLPVYGGIECTKGGGRKNLSADEYRSAAAHLIRSKADGIYLFNFFTSREEGANAYEPPYEVLGNLPTARTP